MERTEIEAAFMNVAALAYHFRLTLRLNLRSKQAMVYGYLVPFFFLIAFGSVFRSGVPPLLGEMGQLLTITVLGGACFGLPTALVAERERGVWRRYRLLPSAGGLLASVLLARFLIVASAALMQIILARLFYGTPFPAHPVQVLVAFTFVTFSFMGMGLVIAALADNVPAVQALGQSVFLPMIMIGGVGVPLRVLPAWVQILAGFLPGRYAVQAIQNGFMGSRGLSGSAFDLVALTVIGLAAGVAGTRLFRWDANQHTTRSGKRWVALALLSWILIGIVAQFTGRLKPVPAFVVAPGMSGAEPYESVTTAQIESITYDNLPSDDGTVTPLVPAGAKPRDFDDRDRLQEIARKLATWPAAHEGSVGQRVRNLLSAAAVADVTEDPLEGYIARAIFQQMQAEYPRDQLVKILAWVILDPNGGTVFSAAPELDLQGKVAGEIVRQRDDIYARKFLGRLLGKMSG